MKQQLLFSGQAFHLRRLSEAFRMSMVVQECTWVECSTWSDERS